MAEIGFDFTRADIEELARKLDSVDAGLTERDRAILLSIFWAARDHVSARAKEPESPWPTGESLQEQILQAFIPGRAERYYFTQPLVIGRIGSDTPQHQQPVPPPPPPPPPPPDEH